MSQFIEGISGYQVLMIGLQVLAGLLYCNGFEWAAHKYILHGLGRKPGSMWAFHWSEHHRNARRNGFVDPDYKRPLFEWSPQSKEVLALLAAAVPHLPLLWYAPAFALTLLYGGFNYYIVHRRSHTNPQWAKDRIPWHHDHHMGVNQNLNFCVTKPWFDWIMRTRKKYLAASGVHSVDSKALSRS